VSPRRVKEINTTERTLILKLDIEDAQLHTATSSNAEDMVDQTRMTRVLMPLSDAQVFHGSQSTSRQVKNSESPEKVGYTEKPEITYGDHLLHTTSGTTTTVLELFAKIWVT